MSTLKELRLPFVSPPDSDGNKSALSLNESFSMDSNQMDQPNKSGKNVSIVTLASSEKNHQTLIANESKSESTPSQKRKRWKKIAKKKPRLFGNEILTNSRKYLTVPLSPNFYIKPNYYDNGDNTYTRLSFHESNEKIFEGQSLKRSTRSRKDLSSPPSSFSSSTEALVSCTKEPSSSSSLSSSTSSSKSSTSEKMTTDKVSKYKRQIDGQFIKHIAALRDYKNKYGDFNIPSTYPPNQPLSNWVGNINYSYNLIKRGYNGTIRLSEDRLAMLDEIGYVFKDMNVHTKTDSSSKVKAKRKNSVDLHAGVKRELCVSEKRGKRK